MSLNLKFTKLTDTAVIPAYATEGSVGMDLTSIADVVLLPMVPTLVPTGLVVELTSRIEAQVRPRSGLSLKGVTVFNSPGTIDSDYRGELKVILLNINKEPYHVKAGDRIAQLVIAKVFRAVPYEREEDLLPVNIQLASVPLVRGTGGFGSTGV
ncbi:MAG: dUTP diphosphatase [Chitinophagaceae bacterium]|nr:dUTP diphosphatase [Chitinophagaceae bacterium]